MIVSEAPSVSRQTLVDWYRRNRARSRALFDLIDPAVYFTRPIALRNPIVFYEGHLPAFSVISFLRRGLGRPAIDERLEALFARGIDPESEHQAIPRSGADTRWPSREQILEYGQAADEAIVAAIQSAEFDIAGREHAAMAGGEAIFTALEHEAMHQETLLYMWHRLPYANKRKPLDLSYDLDAAPPRHQTITVFDGEATLGARRGVAFGWDNEFDARVINVPAFGIDAHSVTNADFLEFIADGGYDRGEFWDDVGWEWRQRENIRHPSFWIRGHDGTGGERWLWRGMFEDVPLPLAWPVYVSQAEAAAFARWKGRRLPTEAEYHRAAFGAQSGGERDYPWGAAPPQPAHGNFDFQSWEPVPAGGRPDGVSGWGVHDLVGNGWEWTSTVFAPFPGFKPMASYPEYSAEFFDGQHVVLKGASPATARELVRRSFRNWFRPNYPFVYAKFRTVSPL